MKKERRKERKKGINKKLTKAGGKERKINE